MYNSDESCVKNYASNQKILNSSFGLENMALFIEFGVIYPIQQASVGD